MQIYLAVTPAEAQEAARFRCSLAHVAIASERIPRSCGRICCYRPGAGSCPSRTGTRPSSPVRSSWRRRPWRECGRRGYGGVLLDFEQPPAPDRLAFAQALAKRLAPPAPLCGRRATPPSPGPSPWSAPPSPAGASSSISRRPPLPGAGPGDTGPGRPAPADGTSPSPPGARRAAPSASRNSRP